MNWFSRLIPCFILFPAILLAASCSHLGRDPVTHGPKTMYVLVMDFEINIPDRELNSHDRSLAEMMTANLINKPRVSMIERQKLKIRLNRIRRDSEGWRKLGRSTGWDYVVIGSISRQGRNYVISSRLLSLTTGRVVPGTAVNRACEHEEDFYPVIQAISNELGFHIRVRAEELDKRMARASHE
jgi:TolB-like protein